MLPCIFNALLTEAIIYHQNSLSCMLFVLDYVNVQFDWRHVSFFFLVICDQISSEIRLHNSALCGWSCKLQAAKSLFISYLEKGSGSA